MIKPDLPPAPKFSPATAAQCERLLAIIRETLPSCFIPASEPIDPREEYEREHGIMVEPERWTDETAFAVGKAAA